MNEIVSYLLQFMARDPRLEVGRIGYTAKREEWMRYRLVIVPSGLFDEAQYLTVDSLPRLPLPRLGDTPLLFGEAREEWVGNTLVIHADIVAGAYFLLSRYEETVRTEERDEHGRFPGRSSLGYRGGFLDRPIVEEYGLHLRQWMAQVGITLPACPQGFEQINLTFDVDFPLRYHRWQQLRSIDAWRTYRMPIDKDPLFTYPLLVQAYREMAKGWGNRVELLSFWLVGKEAGYSYRSGRIGALIRYLRAVGTRFGLHNGYRSGRKPSLIATEAEALRHRLQSDIEACRYHFLRQLSPIHYRYLTEALLHRDYTMGYADVAGFRLGTCRPVRAIDPIARQLLPLHLYPLTLMDCTLDRPAYMDLSYDQALAYAQRLCDATCRHGGTLTLLWHNTSLTPSEHNYHPRLLNALAQYIKTLSPTA